MQDETETFNGSASGVLRDWLLGNDIPRAFWRCRDLRERETAAHDTPDDAAFFVHFDVAGARVGARVHMLHIRGVQFVQLFIPRGTSVPDTGTDVHRDILRNIDGSAIVTLTPML